MRIDRLAAHAESNKGRFESNVSNNINTQKRNARMGETSNERSSEKEVEGESASDKK